MKKDKDNKAKVCDIVLFVDPESKVVTHVAIVVDVDGDGNPTAVIGQAGPALPIRLSSPGGVAQPGAPSSDMEFLRPDPMPAGRPSDDQINDAQKDAKNGGDPKPKPGDPKAGSGARELWLHLWDLCVERDAPVTTPAPNPPNRPRPIPPEALAPGIPPAALIPGTPMMVVPLPSTERSDLTTPDRGLKDGDRTERNRESRDDPRTPTPTSTATTDPKPPGGSGRRQQLLDEVKTDVHPGSAATAAKDGKAALGGKADFKSGGTANSTKSPSDKSTSDKSSSDKSAKRTSGGNRSSGATKTAKTESANRTRSVATTQRGNSGALTSSRWTGRSMSAPVRSVSRSRR